MTKYIPIKFLTVLVFLWSSASYFLAQNYQITYLVKFKPVKEADSFKTEFMMLDIVKDQSIFYNLDKEKIDSLVSKNKIKDALSLQSPLLRLRVSKKLSKNYCAVGIAFNQFDYWYEEKAPQYQNLKKSGNYKAYAVNEAYTVFGKRKWLILYTNDIPINDGPYVFYGLPGLVLKAESLDGDYTFEVTEVKKINNLSLPVQQKANIKKEKFSKNITDFIKDPASRRINFRNDLGDRFTYDFNGIKDINYKETNEQIKTIIQKFNNYSDKDIPVITF